MNVVKRLQAGNHIEISSQSLQHVCVTSCASKPAVIVRVRATWHGHGVTVVSASVCM